MLWCKQLTHQRPTPTPGGGGSRLKEAPNFFKKAPPHHVG